MSTLVGQWANGFELAMEMLQCLLMHLTIADSTATLKVVILKVLSNERFCEVKF